MAKAIAKEVGGKGKTITLPKDAKRPATPRPKQGDLPTMENRDIPEIEEAADAYVQVRDERCELSKIESDKKSLLIGALKKHGRTVYNYNGLEVNLLSVDNVKVKSNKASDDDDE